MNNMNQMMGNMNMNMNQAGMSSTLMTNFAMDDTAMKIKAIIDPYEKKIIDLEKIIRQKDFEILVLKEKLNNYKNSQMNNNNNQMGMGMNDNQMGMGMNNNPMGMGMNMGNQMGINMGNDMNMMNQNMMNIQMPPMMNPMVMNDKPMWMWHYNDLNNNQNLNDENNSSNKINIVFRRNDGNPPILVMCDYTEKISEVIKRYCIKAGIDKYHDNFKFVFNAKKINLDLTVAESGITNNSVILVIVDYHAMMSKNDININLEQNNENKKEKKINIRFSTTQGTITNISFNENGSIGDLIKLYLKRVDRPDLISSLMKGDKNLVDKKLVFLWNAIKLDINDTKKAKYFFKNDMKPKIVVNDIHNLIGA